MDLLGEPQYADLKDPHSWYNIGAALFCVACAALAAGLTVVSTLGVEGYLVFLCRSMLMFLSYPPY